MANHRLLPAHVPPRRPAGHSQFCLVLCSTLMPADSPPLAAKVAYLRSLCGRGDEVIETHFAWVFLIGDRAWKLRKPVRRDTMDYTTLEARRLDSLADVRLNRRLAPGIYLAVAPLTQSVDGQFAIDGPGQIVDWLVCMRRLDRAQLLEARLARGPVDAASLQPVTRLLADFYRAAAPAISDGPAFVARVARQVENNHRVLASADGVDVKRCLHGSGNSSRSIRRCSRSAPPAAASWRRTATCGQSTSTSTMSPAVIDCLEFDRDLRVLDRAEELSFLHLECTRLGHEATGNALLRGCLAQLADHATDALLHFYRSHRATTRAKIYAWRATEPDGGTPGEWLARAAGYMSSALDDSARSLD